jgi:hypothetical protein
MPKQKKSLQCGGLRTHTLQEDNEKAKESRSPVLAHPLQATRIQQNQTMDSIPKQSTYTVGTRRRRSRNIALPGQRA